MNKSKHLRIHRPLIIVHENSLKVPVCPIEVIDGHVPNITRHLGKKIERTGVDHIKRKSHNSHTYITCNRVR